MSVITRLGGDKLGPVNSGPEQYAPPDWRPREKLSDVAQAAANAFEGELQDVVRRDVSLLHRQDADPANDAAVENLDNLIRRVAGASMKEIDGVILELQGVRDMLRNEGERLSHEIARYATLNRMSMTAMKAIADSLKQSKGVPKLGADG
jgi:hypothetical protein